MNLLPIFPRVAFIADCGGACISLVSFIPWSRNRIKAGAGRLGGFALRLKAEGRIKKFVSAIFQNRAGAKKAANRYKAAPRPIKPSLTGLNGGNARVLTVLVTGCFDS